MKICLVSRKFDKSSGSAEWIYADKVKEELISRGYTVYTIEQKDSGIYSSKIKKIFHDFFVLPAKLLYYRIFKHVKLYHFFTENQAIYSWLLRLLGVSTIVNFHDLMGIKLSKKLLRKNYFFLIYWLATFTNIIICNSIATKNDLIMLNPFCRKKIVLVYPVHRKLSKKKLIKNKGEFIIGYLGALNYRKRPFLLLDLARKIKQNKIQGLHIHVWGQGPTYDYMINKIKKERLSSFISMKGFASEEKINSIYHSFDFFVFPSLYEGLGLPAIEAMMVGLPVFVLNDAYIPHEVKKGCIICKNIDDLLNKIIYLMSNKKAYIKACKKSISCSRRFEFNRNIKKLINLYKKLAK